MDRVLVIKGYLLVLACIFCVSDTSLAETGWYGSDWKYRQKLVIKEAFYVTDKEIKDFPVLVVISNKNNEVFKKVKPDGADIVFTGSDGVTKLAHEIERYRAGEGKELVCWVKVPIIYVDSNTEFYLYYGNPKVEDQQDVGQVWATEFTSVWHFNESVFKGSKGEIKDSTDNANHGTINDGTKVIAKGKIGGAFKGSINVPFTIDGNKPMTVEAWVYHSEVDWTGYLFAQAHLHFRHTLNNNWTFMIYGGPKGNSYMNIMDKKLAGDWEYVVGIYNPLDRTIRMFLNGTYMGNKAWSGSWHEVLKNMSSSMRIGAIVEGHQPPVIDEVRFSNVVRSKDWIAVCFKNQGYPQRIIFGKEQERSR